ncbi:MAG TPA: M15 family metallopeptidase [Cellulomonas sp.]|uniref:M15 family metallopeptidase n=1 Tax=Cellulomonas sp. TaxID=40001 RepID=UPI002E318B34|nr:M15 family metallopeptidase [Cellulomonas sp.]HEX5333057.1 M15 family metallopeptidase [Cellulomonas sp.]
MSGDAPDTESRGARRPSTGAVRRRLLTWLAPVVVVVVVAASFAVVQVRAARAADVRAATQRVVEADATQAARVAADAAAARDEAARLAREASVAAERAAAVTTVQTQVATAEPVLAASEGKVDDDAVRRALATAIEAARTTITAAAEPVSATAPDAAAILAAGTAVDTARGAVEAAQATWRQAAEAAAAAAAAAKRSTAASTPAAAGSSAADLAAAAAAAKAKAAAGGVPVSVTSVPTADGDGSNGHMPMSSMCLIGWGTDQIGSPQYLRCDAADALAGLNDAFRARFGESLAMDLTYRSYDEQMRIAAYYGALAAKPGTSSHGLGTALDVQEWPGVYGFGTERYVWLVASAPTYGWFAPARVRETGAYPEYWHYEYGPGRTS